MKVKLLVSAVLKFLLGLILVSALVFLPVMTLDYINGWIFIGILFVPMFVVGICMLVKKPDLLKRRITLRERQKEQKLVVTLSGMMFVFGFILSGICQRYGILRIPLWLSIVFAAVFLFGYILYGVVLCQNEYLSRNIEVFDGQKVVDKGLYAVVRHPMYLSTVIMFLSIPAILGSLLPLVVFMFYPFIIVYRIKNEERFLESELLGYTEYKKKVKFRMIPFIW